MKKRYKYIYYKKKGNAFGFQAVGFSLADKMEMCIDLISGGVISVKCNQVVRDKDSENDA